MASFLRRMNTNDSNDNDNDNNNNNQLQAYMDKSFFCHSFNKIYSSASILFDDDDNNIVTTPKIYPISNSNSPAFLLKRRDSPRSFRKVHETTREHIIANKEASVGSLFPNEEMR